MELIPAACGGVGHLRVQIGPHHVGRAGAERVYELRACGIVCLHFLFRKAPPPPIGCFWLWVSISDERFHGEKMTFTSTVDMVISFDDHLLIISASPLPHCWGQSRLSCPYYLLKELQGKRPRLMPNN